MYSSRQRTVIALALLLSTAAMAAALAQTQQRTQQQAKPKQTTPDQQPQQQEDAQPKSAATAPVTVKSTRKPRDQASAGFKGIGDDGKVTQASLNANATSDAGNKALQLSVYAVPEAEVQTFITEGKLVASAVKPAAK